MLGSRVQEEAMNAKEASLGRRNVRFGVYWTLASGLGLGVGSVISHPLSSDFPPLIAWAVLGVCIGTAQSLVLRGRIPGAIWWVPASIAGWLSLAVLHPSLSFMESDDLARLFAAGVALALTHAIILRSLLPSARSWVWWALAGGVAMVGAGFFGNIAGWIVYDFTSNTDWADRSGVAAGGLILGLITFFPLMLLLRELSFSPSNRSRFRDELRSS